MNLHERFVILGFQVPERFKKLKDLKIISYFKTLNLSWIYRWLTHLLVFSWQIKADNLNNVNVLQAWTASLPDGYGLSRFPYILHSLWLILAEDGPAAQEDGLSICQWPWAERSAMLRRMVGFKWYILP